MIETFDICAISPDWRKIQKLSKESSAPLLSKKEP